MIKKIRQWVLKSKAIREYYRAQQFVDIAWGEFSWFTDSLVEMMAILYILEKLGLVLEGPYVVLMLFLAFSGCYLLGRLFKVIGTYDKSVYVDVDIDPVRKLEYEAAKLIIERYGSEQSKTEML